MPVTYNMPSAREHPEVVQQYLADELAKNRFLGPFPPGQIEDIHVNRFGVIPKGHTSKWRLITDLSFPEGLSLNNVIDLGFCSLTYTSVDDVALIVSRLRKGTLMAKIDIEAAYRLLPIHPRSTPTTGYSKQSSGTARCL